MDINIKMPVKTKVSLKIIFSKPRRVKEEEPLPQTLPKPVPLFWINIKTIIIILTATWNIKR